MGLNPRVTQSLLFGDFDFLKFGQQGFVLRPRDFDFATQRQVEIYTAELQHIQQNDWNTLIVGTRWQGGEFFTWSKGEQL